MDEAPIIEQRSSIKVGQTAKGEPVVEIKVVDNFDQARLNAMHDAAVDLFKRTVGAVGA